MKIKLSELSFKKIKFDQRVITGIRSAIKVEGFCNPIVVERRRSKFIIVDGYKRCWAMHQLGEREIETVVKC